jgi:hypothetical protein
MGVATHVLSQCNVTIGARHVRREGDIVSAVVWCTTVVRHRVEAARLKGLGGSPVFQRVCRSGTQDGPLSKLLRLV